MKKNNENAIQIGNSDNLLDVWTNYVLKLVETQFTPAEIRSVTSLFSEQIQKMMALNKVLAANLEEELMDIMVGLFEFVIEARNEGLSADEIENELSHFIEEIKLNENLSVFDKYYDDEYDDDEYEDEYEDDEEYDDEYEDDEEYEDDDEYDDEYEDEDDEEYEDDDEYNDKDENVKGDDKSGNRNKNKRR
jgi:hypothetical protein